MVLASVTTASKMHPTKGAQLTAVGEKLTSRLFQVEPQWREADGVPIAVGMLVETIKGAKFTGIVLALYDIGGRSPGAVVEAIHPDFLGVRHVYPLAQLRQKR